MNGKIVIGFAVSLCVSGVYAQETKTGVTENSGWGRAPEVAKSLLPDDEVPVPQDIAPEKPFVLPEYEMVPGMREAVRLTLRGFTIAPINESERNANWLVPAPFIKCATASISFNYWVMSHHQGERTRPLEENNRGKGIVFTCDGWSFSVDRMINSNRGKATVIAIVWSAQMELGPVFVRGSAGYAAVSYGIPRYNVTVRDNTNIGYVSFGLTDFPKFSVNVAPVPKVAGNAYILWVTYRIAEFK